MGSNKEAAVTAVSLVLLVAITLVTYRPVYLADPNQPDWDRLWDDDGNFHRNKHLSPLSIDNIVWALKDGTIHSVYEPVSLIIKMILYATIPRLFGIAAIDAKTLRLINLSAHIINVCIVFLVGKSLLVAANDYEFYVARIKGLIVLKEERLRALSRPSSNTISTEKGHSDVSAWLTDAKKALERLEIHRYIGLLGCWLGTALFATHPLQAQLIGWASCMSYFFACTFALLSYWHYVHHRVVMRQLRRSKREVVGIDYKLIRRPRKGLGKKGKQTCTAGPESDHETFVLTRNKVASLVYYVLATFSKAPAIVLPGLFVITDVFIFSAPCGVQPGGRDILNDILETQLKNEIGSQQLDAPRSLPDLFQRLWSLTIRAIKASALLLFCTPFMAWAIVAGNMHNSAFSISLIEKIMTAATALGWYVVKLINPTNLRATVEMREISVSSNPYIGLCLILIPLATIAVLYFSLAETPMRIVTCTWGSMIALLIPALGFVQHSGNHVYAGDRYMYIPLCMAAPFVGSVLCGYYTLSTSYGYSPPLDDALIAGGQIPDHASSISSARLPIDSFDACAIAELVDGRSSKRKSMKRKSRDGTQRVDRSKTDVVPPDTTRVALNTRRFGTVCLLGVTLCTLGVIAFFGLNLTPAYLNYWRNSKLLWERNLQFNPDSINTHVHLCSLYSTIVNPPDLDKALFHAKSAVALTPDGYENRFNLAAIYLQRNDLEESVELFGTLLRENVRHPLGRRAIVELAIGQHKLGDWDTAQKNLEQAVKLREPRAKAALEALLKLKADPDANDKQREWWKKLRDSRNSSNHKEGSLDSN